MNGLLQHSYQVHDEVSFNMAMAMLKRFCREQNLNEAQSAKFLTSASELGRNILKYADRGEIGVRSLTRPCDGIEIEVRAGSAC